MVWSACSICGAVQLGKLPSIAEIYIYSHTEGIGTKWRRHDSRFRAFVEQFAVAPVLYIDRSRLDGMQLACPEPRAVSEGTVVHSHWMEHWRRPREVLEHLAARMAEGSRMIFSIPAMDPLLAAGVISTLNFEHSFLLGDRAVHSLLQHAGFTVLARNQFADHSVFYACERREKHPAWTAHKDSRSRQHAKQALSSQRRDAQQTIKALDAFEGPAYLFGAHVFSQYLVALGLKESRFEAVLDNSAVKAGKRLYGTNLQVISPRDIPGDRKAMVVIRAGPYDKEIREGILRDTNGNVVFG